MLRKIIDTQLKTDEIERACCLAQFRSIERPWMCISVDRPLWEGSKPVSIPAGAWTPLRSCPIPKAMPTETPSPWRIESLLVSLTMEKRARHAGNGGRGADVPVRIQISRKRKEILASARGWIGNRHRDAELHYARVINCSTSRNRCHETLESTVTLGELPKFNEGIGYARI